MSKAAARLGFIRFCLSAGILAVVARAAQLQLVRGGEYAERAERGRTVTEPLPARRGALYDRGMLPLAETQEVYHVSLAPEQVTDRAALARIVGRALHEDSREIGSRLGSGARSVYFFGPYTALDVQSIRSLDGVHLESFLRRVHPMGDLADRTLGTLEPDTAVGASGLEGALDSLLTGIPGETVQLRDHLGRRFDSPSRLVRAPVAGNSVVLTLDARLQEIAERGLDAALDSLEASSGDVVFLDPSTGELLAVASRVSGEQSSASAFATPYEPGSTAKLFTAAALLLHHAVDSSDTVSGEDGDWLVPTTYGRPYHIRDDHKTHGGLTLAQAIEVSSNIAMAKFARRLTNEQLYETLRAFGFGSYTGVGFPGESRGQLPRPEPPEWTRDYTLESLSRGYNLSVTAIQLAAAYAVIANGGVLYAPTLVKEVRAPDGAVLYRHAPEPVRRVLPEEIAAVLRRYLKGAVGAGGTGERGQIQNYELVGKTGTAKIAVDGSYGAGQYVASFAAIWPADHPQIVAVVKIDRPRVAYYAAQTAAPLTRAMLEEALASQNRALRTTELASPSTPSSPSPFEQASAQAPEAPMVRARWPAQAQPTSAPDTARVPDVVGRDTRAAAVLMFKAGLRVRLADGPGRVTSTEPADGSSLLRGATVTLHTSGQVTRTP